MSCPDVGKTGGRKQVKVFACCSVLGDGEEFWYGKSGPLHDVVRPTLSLPAAATSTFNGALQDSFHKAIVAGDMSKPR